jgi:hypothetical protein
MNHQIHLYFRQRHPRRILQLFVSALRWLLVLEDGTSPEHVYGTILQPNIFEKKLHPGLKETLFNENN